MFLAVAVVFAVVVVMEQIEYRRVSDVLHLIILVVLLESLEHRRIGKSYTG